MHVHVNCRVSLRRSAPSYIFALEKKFYGIWDPCCCFMLFQADEDRVNESVVLQGKEADKFAKKIHTLLSYGHDVIWLNNIVCQNVAATDTQFAEIPGVEQDCGNMGVCFASVMTGSHN